MDEKDHEKLKRDLIDAAATASEVFGDDECEAYADQMRKRREHDAEKHDNFRRQAAEGN